MERKQVERLLIGTLAVLVVGACCYWSGLWWYVPSLAQMWANHLDRVKGKAELLGPAQWYGGGGELSPDGRKMVIRRERRGQEEFLVWNLVTGEQHPLDIQHASWLLWVNANQIAVNDYPDYYLVNANDLSVIKLERVPKETYMKPGGFQIIEPLLRQAREIYAVEGWGSDYKLIVLTEAHSYLVPLSSYEFGITNEELDALVAEIPHVDVPKFGWGRPLRTDERAYSPDGRFYTAHVSVDSVGGEKVAIYTREGELVAEAYKGGWYSSILGWAHDSSGVYFEMGISGDAASCLVPYMSLFKLSPFTEAEARWAMAWRIGKWTVGVLAVLGTGWWLWKRRRAVTQV